jgi:hypothetical protein
MKTPLNRFDLRQKAANLAIQFVLILCAAPCDPSGQDTEADEDKEDKNQDDALPHPNTPMRRKLFVLRCAVGFRG